MQHLLFLIITVMSITNMQGAVLGLLSPEAKPDAIWAYKHSYYDAAGNWVTLVAGADEQANSLISALKLPVGADAIQWVFPVQEDHAGVVFPRIALQGLFGEAGVQISEVIPAGLEQPLRELIPVGTNIIKVVNMQAFGREERVSSTKDFSFSWSKGEKPAGILIRHNLRWPNVGAYVCEIVTSGQGNIEVALSNQKQLEEESPEMVKTIELSSESKMHVLQGVGAAGHEWVGLTLLASNDPGWIKIHSITIRPQIAPTPRKTSAWIWSPEVWKKQPKLIWELQIEFKLNQVYITVPVEKSSVQDSESLAGFIRDSTVRGLEISAVVGDPQFVLQETRPALLEHLKAFRDYNQKQPQQERLSSVQLDIEPHLLMGFHLNPTLWRDRYLQAIRDSLKVTNGVMPLDLVVPVWWGAHPQFGTPLLSQLDQDGLSLTVMNYRTDINRLLEDAAPFMQWSKSTGNDVRIALETGHLLDEQRRSYSRNPTKGQLWLVDVGERRFWILFKKPVEGLPGKAYQFTHEIKASASQLTFEGREDQFKEILNQVHAVWSQWPGYRGIAIHGLDSHWKQQTDD